MPGANRKSRRRRGRAKPAAEAEVPVPVPEAAAMDDDEAWSQLDIRAMKLNLLNLIHRYYLEAFSRLPSAELRATLARGVLVSGHCFGTLRPSHNIIVHAIWYATAFPHPAATDDDGGGGYDTRALLPTDGIARICHRSLEGLVAALRHYCPSVSAATALYHLMCANADLGSAIALANGTSKSSALRVMYPLNLAAFQLAAEAAQHPNPTAFAHFASALPTINAKDSLLQYLLINYMLSPGNIDHLTTVLVPELPDEPPLPPLTIRPQVLDWISSQKQLFKETGRQVLDVVNMASQHYTIQTGEQLVLHSVSGASLVRDEEEGPDNCYYHINFLANRKYSDSALGFPVVMFTEATVLAHDEICINLCVIVDPAKEIASCFACESNKKKIVHPTYDDFLGCRDFEEDEVDLCGSNFPKPVDADYIFFDADRDSAVAKYLDDRVGCDGIYRSS